MRRFFAFSGVAAIALIWGCRGTTPVPPTPVPNLPGCALGVQALGNNLVSGMTWTNATTGHSGTGNQSMSIPEGGTIKINIYADPSIACATNLPNVVLVTWQCKTNPPVYQFWQLPSACNGFQKIVTTDCTTCAFSASQSIGFDCYIYRPGQ